ncbi:MAG TPA: hypothetical protein VII43_00675 [Opitutaceae bacterium]
MSTVAVAGIFILLSAFGLITMRVYLPGRPPAPQNQIPDNLSKELAWRATPATRRDYLAELRKKQAEQASTYAWVDKKAGVVQLPIARAVELIVSEHAAKQ